MSDEMNKNHEATQSKLADARKKGQIAKSTEISAFFGLTASLTTLIAILNTAAAHLAEYTSWWLARSHLMARNNAVLWDHLLSYAETISRTAIAISLAGLIAAIIATIVHVGPVFSTHPLKPDFSRMNPSKGFEKIFSRKTIVDTIRLPLKIAAFSFIMYMAWKYNNADILSSNHASMQQLGQNWAHAFSLVVFSMLGIFLVFSIIDLIYMRKDFLRQMRMSTRELKDETKRREGDPQIKAKRKRALQELLASASSIKNVKDSDVIITNPSHIAIALKYRAATMSLPIVTTRGQGLVAAGIRKAARKHGIPTVRKPSLARSLLASTQLGDTIPEEHQNTVANIYRWVLSMQPSKVFQ